MIRLLKRIVVLLVFVISFTAVQAQSPNLVKFSTSNIDGRYNTNNDIVLEAEFDDWLGVGSEVRVRLNTGDEVVLKFDPKYAYDLLDAKWGEKGKRNAFVDASFYGLGCILELEGKGGHTENKGKFALGGAYYSYEESGNDFLVITDADGKLLQGYGGVYKGAYGSGTKNDCKFNDEVRWVIETSDGGLLVGGEFTNYGGNANYDYVVKFKPDLVTVDEDFMTKLCTSSGAAKPALNAMVAPVADTFGRPGFCMAEDEDGSIFIMGQFTQVGGVSRTGVVKLNANGSVNTAFDAAYLSGYGSTVAIDGNSIWVGASGATYWRKSGDLANVYGVDRLDKQTGARAAGYTPIKFYANYGVLGLRVMPEPTDPKTPGPGGVLVTGKFYGVYENGSSVNGENFIVSLQDNGSVTPRGTGIGKFSVDKMFNSFWAIDGMDLLKGKIWIGVHDGHAAAPAGDRFFEGALAVLNLDGTAATSFNNMFNANLQINAGGTYTANAARVEGFHNGGNDILAVSKSSRGHLLVGGNYASFMEYEDDGYGLAGVNYNVITDDQVVTRLNFNRARGTYKVSADDIVSPLEIISIVSYNVKGAFDEPSGIVAIENILPENNFNKNHKISINSPMLMAEDAFVMNWQTTASAEVITIPLEPTKTYDFYVDWGDGKLINGVYDLNVANIQRFTGLGSALNVTHTYANAGTYTVRISGAIVDANDKVTGQGFPQISFAKSTAAMLTKVKSVEQWGKIQWASMEGAFKGCTNLVLNATDVPNLAAVTTLASMFEGASMVNSDISTWNVSTITNMSRLFYGASVFNQDLSAWNTSAVTDMSYMFDSALAFNQDLSAWNVAKVKSMEGMFKGATAFNKDLSVWNVSLVDNMAYMFKGATAFDQNLSAWQIKALANADGMFDGATLSLANYDALLIGWCAQVNALTAKKQVKFHGGNSKWCMAESARMLLINNGWGDGVLGATTYGNTDATAILDGGSSCTGMFVTQWEIPANKTLTIQRKGDMGLPMDISWGDGAVEYGLTGEPTHTFSSNNVGDIVTIKMDGGVNMYWENGQDSKYLVKVIRFGDIAWSSMENMFAYASKMVFDAAVDVPNLNNVTSLNNMFLNCAAFNSSLAAWNWSAVTSLENTFSGATSFNAQLPATIGAVINMAGTFKGATAFNQNITGWNVSGVTTMASLFDGAAAFNQNITSWNVSRVQNMSAMFRNAISFDQAVGTWNISALTNAANMFNGIALSLANYDALLNNWWSQVNAGTAKKFVPFHGGASNYCDGEVSRQSLIANGWGDGVVGAQNNNYPDIIDGGSASPNISGVLVNAVGVFQNANAIISLSNTNPAVIYYARIAGSSNTPVQVTGNSSADVKLNMGPIATATTYEMWAAPSAGGCSSYFNDVTVKVYQRVDLTTSSVNVETAGNTVVANGVATHVVKVTVLDVLGSPISGAEVKLAATANVTSAITATTDASGVATFSLKSSVSGTYRSNIEVYNRNPENAEAVAGGLITHTSNPATYTFGADKPTNVSLTWLTDGQNVTANNIKTHQFLVKLKDNAGNVVANNEVTVSATPQVEFYSVGASKDTTYYGVGVAPTGLKTNAAGELKIYARSTKAWTNFTSTVKYLAGATYEAFPDVTYSYVSGGVGAYTIAVGATKQTAGDNIALTMTLLDAYGNPCRGEKAILRQATLKNEGTTTTAVTYNAAVGRLEGITGNDGKFTAQVSSAIVGEYTTEGVVLFNGVEPIKGKTVSYEFIPSNPDAGDVVLERNHATADGVEYNQIIVIIKDKHNNPIAGTNVKIEANANINWGSGLNADHIVVTNAEGKAIFNGTSTTAADYSTTVFLHNGTDYVAIKSVNHTFMPGTIDLENSTLLVVPAVQVADGTSTILLTATFKDASTNIVPNAKAIFYNTDKVTAALPAASTDVLSTDTDGNWIVQDTGDGIIMLEMTSTTAKDYATQCAVYVSTRYETFGLAEYTFIPGPASAANSKVSVSLNNQSVGGKDKIKVQLFDANDNAIETLVAATTLDFAATTDVKIGNSASGAIYSNALAIGANGTFEVEAESNKAGTYSTAVTILGVALGGSPVSYNFLAGVPSAANSSYVITNNGALIPDGEVTITATIKDQYNNLIPSVNVGFKNRYKSDNVLDFGMGVDADGTAVTDASGNAEVKVKSAKVGRFDAEIAFNTVDWNIDYAGANALATVANPASFYFVDAETAVDDVTADMAIVAKWYVQDATDLLNDPAKAIELANAQAWNLTGNAAKPTITVSGLDAIASKAGPYKITFKATNAASEEIERKDVVVSVKDDQTSVDETAGIAIRANGYTISSATAASQNLATATTAGSAIAWSLSDGSDLMDTETVLDAAELAAVKSGVAGVYPLTFKTTLGGKTFTRTIEVRVISDADWFITTWAVAAGETITIPTVGSTYNFSINWGEGNVEELAGAGPFSHTYAAAGTYTIKIAGVFPRIVFNGGQEGQQADKIQEVQQWGTIAWASMASAFEGCTNLTITATDVPNLAGVTSMTEMFRGAVKINSATIPTWNVGNVTDMSNMFYGATAFNQDLSTWNVGNVTTMQGMFTGAKAFNQNIAGWNVAQVSNMVNMFYNATAFNQNLSTWQIKALTNADGMFKNVKLFGDYYDAMLVAWNAQLVAGNANNNVKFHGGFSEYCEAAAERANLILNGWGDGVAGGSATNSQDGTDGIVDGGSGAPITNYAFESNTLHVCDGSAIDIVLMNSQSGVSYQLKAKADDSAVGSVVAGTGAEISFTITPVATAIYYVEATRDGVTCNSILDNEVTVVVDPVSAGGIISSNSANDVVCTGNTVELTLNGHEGTIVRWESSVLGDFKDVQILSATTNPIITDALNQTTTFRAVVQSGACSSTYSANFVVSVDELSVGGAVTGGIIVCSGANAATFTVADYLGDVIRWESSASGDFTDAVSIVETNTTLNVSNVAATTYYRAVIQNGVCAEAYSAADVLTVFACDRGDAPDTYATTIAANGPVHYAPAQNVFIGATAPDNDLDAVALDATGDDTNGTDDEDGLALSYQTDRSSIDLNAIPVVNNTTNEAYLYAWIDVNEDGTFTSEESVSTTIAAGFNGTVDLSLDGFSNSIKAGNYYTRLRVGTVEAEVSIPTGLAVDGEVEDHFICVRPNMLYVDDINVQVCEEMTTVDLNSTLHYVPANAKEIIWKTVTGSVISTPSAYNISALETGDITKLNYTIVEDFCGVDVSGSARLYVEVVSEMNVNDRTLKLCKAEAESVNLSTMLGIAVQGTWTTTSGVEAHLSGNRFAGKAAYGAATTDQTYEFTFTPASGSCMINSPKLTVIITDKF